jgi:hypothetical protein
MQKGICSNGMWLSEKVLLSKSTWDKKTLGKLRRSSILFFEKVAQVLKSNTRDDPFFPLTFYRVKADNASAPDFGPAEDLGVPLSEFIDMCNCLEKFVGDSVESPLS